MGLVYSPVIGVTLLFYLTPIWSSLIGMYWLNEPTTKSRWLAICIGLLGLTLLISQGDGQIPLNIGFIYGFIAGITWAVGGSMMKRYNKIPINSLLFFQLLFAALADLFLDLISGRSPTPSLSLLGEVVPISIAISLLIILPCMLIIFWA
jgi:drug/metabolite transporter (DMT)-like permease